LDLEDTRYLSCLGLLSEWQAILQLLRLFLKLLFDAALLFLQDGK
jgi:hypothetical protein